MNFCKDSMGSVDDLARQTEASLSLDKPSSSNVSTADRDGQPAVMSSPAAPTKESSEAGPLPERPPGLAAGHGRSVEDVLADLNKSPLFMTEFEENDDIAALQALAYEGTPRENAADFKERGNECFRERRWADAKEFYGKGIAILAAEERRRAKGEPPAVKDAAEEAKKGSSSGLLAAGTKSGKEEEGSAEPVPDPDSPDEVTAQRAILEALYVNRAACHLELRNYRSCTLDCAGAIKLNPSNVKAYYRSSRALLALDRIDEADDACARGLALDSTNASLQAMARDIVTRATALNEKASRDRERIERDRRRVLLRRAALLARGIRTRRTAKPPDLAGSDGVTLVPDPDDPHSTLAFPVMLMYPLPLESDFIKAFGERDALEQHLRYVLPLPWDRAGMYTAGSVECFMETRSGGLVKVGKRVPLLKVLTSADVEVVDELVRIYVVPRAKAEGWVKEFKEGKAREKQEK